MTFLNLLFFFSICYLFLLDTEALTWEAGESNRSPKIICKDNLGYDPDIEITPRSDRVAFTISHDPCISSYHISICKSYPELESEYTSSTGQPHPGVPPLQLEDPNQCIHGSYFATEEEASITTVSEVLEPCTHYKFEVMAVTKEHYQRQPAFSNVNEDIPIIVELSPKSFRTTGSISSEQSNDNLASACSTEGSSSPAQGQDSLVNLDNGSGWDESFGEPGIWFWRRRY